MCEIHDCSSGREATLPHESAADSKVTKGLVLSKHFKVRLGGWGCVWSVVRCICCEAHLGMRVVRCEVQNIMTHSGAHHYVIIGSPETVRSDGHSVVLCPLRSRVELAVDSVWCPP